VTSAPPEIDDVIEPLGLPSDRSITTARDVALRLARDAAVVHVAGAEGSAAALIGRAMAERGPLLYVVADADAAARATADLTYLLQPLPLPFAPKAAEASADAVLLLPTPDASPYTEAHPDRRATLSKLAALSQIASERPWAALVTTAAGLLRRVVPRQVLLDAAVRLEADTEIDIESVMRKLAGAGYLRVPVVEDPGTFAVRGGILDAWAPAAELPVRAELYGDLVLSLKNFDPENQRSLDDTPGVWLPPARETVLLGGAETRAKEIMRSLCDAVDLPSSKARALIEDVTTGRAFFGGEGFLPAFYPLASLFSYLPERTPILVEDAPAVLKAMREELERARRDEAGRVGLPHFPLEALYLDEAELDRELGRRKLVSAHRAAAVTGVAKTALESLELAPIDTPTLAAKDHADLERAVKAARSAQGKHAVLDPILRRLSAWENAGLSVVISARNQTQAERTQALLSHRGVAIVSKGEAVARPGAVQIVVGPLARGVIAPAEGFVLVTEEEIFGQRAHRRKERTRSPRSLLEDLRALQPGDYVVHVEHGIGRYLGLERKLIGGVGVDLLVVEYSGGKLFLPIYRLNQIQKYSSAEGAPQLDRLGGNSFAKTKAKVLRKVRQMADELLRLYADRALLHKQPLPPPDDEYAAFEASFPYEETRDQAAAITDVLRDLEKTSVMDRLVCGDVGFGKTEVALRAAFRCAMAGRQVALLCPTTVLTQQHFLTFSNRLAGYPLEVRALSRFQSAREQEDTVRRLKDGTVDVVIGTHRALSKDVHFKNLGLLVVDEEHRFGVTHKERIKQLRTSVDVLTLSATPIPRTLQLAVGGLREMSIITTPPADRRTIRTITSAFDDNLVRDAIRRELERGGQVFYVYNRVEGIHERARHVQELVPEARIAVGHGQMNEAALEQAMLDFVGGNSNVLVSTAIIESGLDIPRANTMVVDRADLFGLAQLYQLRGRVGRSSERAYCYLLVPAPSQMTEEARSRIEALERYTELGSGFSVATLDLELRGGGDLLGAEQSGFVASVGFDLFCQMLEEATHELRGEPVVHEVDPELSFDVEALFPEDYVAEVGVRLSLYKRLASAADDVEVSEIAAEVEDRFGKPPLPASHLIELMRLKTELRRLRVLGCEAHAKAVTLHLRADTPLDPTKLARLVAQKKSPYKLTPDGRLTRRLTEGEAAVNGLVLADRMLDELAQLMDDAPPAKK
jgi:transcription-repair coupling factor (superfamily II helicase)